MEKILPLEILGVSEFIRNAKGEKMNKKIEATGTEWGGFGS
jgi:hypothetical protein